MNSFNKIKLSDLVHTSNNNNNHDKLDLVLYELEYLGNLEIESRYLQSCTIQWLIAQVRLLELNKRVNSVTLEINVKKNSLLVFKNEMKTKHFSLTSLKESNRRVEFLRHKLTNIFKLTQLANEKTCFAYFYRLESSFNYTLHVFNSNKSNLVQVLSEFQMDALKIHENQSIHQNSPYEKLFDFQVVSKVSHIFTTLIFYYLDLFYLEVIYNA